MKIKRKFTVAGEDAYAGINFIKTTSEIRNPDGTIVFKLDDVEVPDTWSQVASDVIAQKYFRKAGVPAELKKIKEKDVPDFLWMSKKSSSTTALAGENSSKQVFDRLAGAWAYWGWKGGYFTEEEDAHILNASCALVIEPSPLRPDNPPPMRHLNIAFPK